MAVTEGPASPPSSAQPSSVKAGKARKRMMIFRGSQARDVREHMPSIGIDDSVQVGLSKLSEATGTYPANSGAKAVVLFSEPGEEGLSLGYAWFKSGYVLPRHSHNADCVYYVLGGELVMGSQTLRKGDGVFIPADAGYTYEAGPNGVEVLEFRNATRFHLMFQGNDQGHWDRIANVLRNNCPKWENEQPPTGGTS